MTVIVDATATGPFARIALHLATIGDNPVIARLDGESEPCELYAADLAALLDAAPLRANGIAMERVSVFLDEHDRAAQAGDDPAALLYVVPRLGRVAPLRVLDVDALLNRCDPANIPEYVEEHAAKLWEATTGERLHSHQSDRPAITVAGVEIPAGNGDSQVSAIGRLVVLAGLDVPDAHRAD